MGLDIIAEVGSVHDGSFGNACKLVELAKNVGATTVKFQMHMAEHETILDAPMPSYFKSEPRYDYFKRTEFSIEQWKELLRIAKENEIDFCCSPFSIKSLEVLLDIGVEKIKIASGEVTNLPLLTLASEVKGQVIVSSGMSSWNELDDAVKVVSTGSADLTVMQCSSEYPCKPSNVGLNVIDDIAKRYQCRTGFSDHTRGYAASIGAVYFGCNSIEKHLTFSRLMYGSDAKNSMEPDEFKLLVSSLNEAKEILDNPVNKDDIKKYSDMKNTFEKSLVSACSLKAGDEIKESLVVFKKPGTGFKTNEIDKIIGRKLKYDIKEDHIFKKSDFI